MAGIAPLDQPRLLALLQGALPIAEIAGQLGTSVAALSEQVLAVLAERLPPANARLRARVADTVEIVRDARGIPHVFAQTVPDLFFGLGFALGQDRLWQLDYYRRRAHGTLAEVLGRSGLASDREARTLGFARVAQQELTRLPPATLAVL